MGQANGTHIYRWHLSGLVTLSESKSNITSTLVQYLDLLLVTNPGAEFLEAIDALAPRNIERLKLLKTKPDGHMKEDQTEEVIDHYPVEPVQWHPAPA